jgi:hypothetical protein
MSLSDKLAEYRLELVFVDDGSGDRSLEILLDAEDKDLCEMSELTSSDQNELTQKMLETVLGRLSA